MLSARQAKGTKSHCANGANRSGVRSQGTTNSGLPIERTLSRVHRDATCLRKLHWKHCKVWHFSAAMKLPYISTICSHLRSLWHYQLPTRCDAERTTIRFRFGFVPSLWRLVQSFLLLLLLLQRRQFFVFPFNRVYECLCLLWYSLSCMFASLARRRTNSYSC